LIIMRTQPRRWFVVLLMASLSPGLLGADAPPGPEGKATVKFELLRTNHMVVAARINGEGPFYLIFDLGAPITLLSNRAGEKSGLIAANAPRAFLFSVRGEAQIDRLQLGDLTARDVPVIVLDHPVLRELGNALGRRLDGIVGYTFFARYRTTIDYQARTMSFEPVDFRVVNLMQDLPERLVGPKVARQVVLAAGGLWGMTLNAPAEGLEAPGVPIREVLAGSPAAQAGLRPGDILTVLGGRWTTSITDVYAAAAAAPDPNVSVVILRDGHEHTLTVRPKPGI
jgi:membrane-associated protease RseP (regulator of RpoE activity)